MNANPVAVIERLRHAWNARDPESMAACFHSDYESIHPCHPERNFRGRDSVQCSWAAIFESIPDFKAELSRQAIAGDVVWTEWRWHGRHLSGAPFEALGVMIFTIVDDQITRARVYSETLQTAGPDWDQILEEILACKPEEKSK